MLDAHMTADAPRAQLIHIETDRRLGHEWDEWDGRPLPGSGDFSAPPGLFFRFAALTIGIGMAVGAEEESRRWEEHTSELQSLRHLVCRLLLEKKKQKNYE